MIVREDLPDGSFILSYGDGEEMYRMRFIRPTMDEAMDKFRAALKKNRGVDA